MKTLFELALELGDSAICESILGKQLYASHVRERISQNARVFPIRNRVILISDYLRHRLAGLPSWVAMANARSLQSSI
jgi:hypothetical protein